MTELVKCPYCSHEVELVNPTFVKLVDEDFPGAKYSNTHGHYINANKYYVECKYCFARGPESDCENEAIETYNQQLFEVLLLNIWNDQKFDELDESKELLILNRKVNVSYIQIYFDVETQKYIVYLIWYADGKVMTKSFKYRNIMQNFSDAVQLFHSVYVKLTVDYNHERIANECNLNPYNPTLGV